MLRRCLLRVLPAALVVPPAAPAQAEADSDWARARAAVQRGEILPLAGILASVEDRYEGRVIETDLHRRHDRWVYEFKLLPPTGRIFTVRVDAATGTLVEIRGPAQERP